MTRATVTRGALVQLLEEAMSNPTLAGWSTSGTGPTNVNAGVDPSAAVTEPTNVQFVPSNRAEFTVAMGQLVRNLPDADVPAIYDAVKRAIDDQTEKDETKDMKTKKANSALGTPAVDETVRRAVRSYLVNNVSQKRLVELARILREAPMVDPADVTADNDPDELEDAHGNPKRPGAYKATALGGMHDVGGATFEKIAGELGFSVAGAKQAVDKALEKARFLAVDLDDEDREIIVLTAMNDYIKMLVSSGELNDADVRLMKSHPEVVRELDGFREFLHNYIRRARKEDAGDDDEPVSSAPVRQPAARPQAANAAGPSKPAVERPAPGGPKAAYKIYKGGPKWGGRPVVTRVKGKVYGPSGETQFAPNEQGAVSASPDGRLQVKKLDSDHTQSWEPVDEG